MSDPEWTKGSGARIVIKFTHPILLETIVGSITGFTVSGQEYSYIGGPLINGDYRVATVTAHPTEPNAILLTMMPLKRFRNVEGHLTVDYSVVGGLAGSGGVVQDFQTSFLPEALQPMPNPSQMETIRATTIISIILHAIMHIVIGSGPYPTEKIMFQKGKYSGEPENPFSEEKLNATLSDFSLSLIHINQIDP